jgi:hypothetical protein
VRRVLRLGVADAVAERVDLLDAVEEPAHSNQVSVASTM